MSGGWFWLSFCDTTRPAGSQFLGVCIVEGADTGDMKTDLAAAIHRAHSLGCNPGGSVKSQRIMESLEPKIHPKWRNRLLNKQECEEFNQEFKPHGVN